MRLPYVIEYLRKKPDSYLASCDECRRTMSKADRQAVGCGYEPRVLDVSPWSPIQINPKWKEPPGEPVCPGYLVSLPAVQEIAEARWWAKNATLRDWTGGEQPTDQLMQGIQILEGASLDLEAFKSEEARHGAQ